MSFAEFASTIGAIDGFSNTKLPASLLFCAAVTTASAYARADFLNLRSHKVVLPWLACGFKLLSSVIAKFSVGRGLVLFGFPICTGNLRARKVVNAPWRVSQRGLLACQALITAANQEAATYGILSCDAFGGVSNHHALDK